MQGDSRANFLAKVIRNTQHPTSQLPEWPSRGKMCVPALRSHGFLWYLDPTIMSALQPNNYMEECLSQDIMINLKMVGKLRNATRVHSMTI